MPSTRWLPSTNVCPRLHDAFSYCLPSATDSCAASLCAHNRGAQPEHILLSLQISRSVFGDRLDRWTNMRCARCTTRRAHAASRACAHDDGKAEVAEVGVLRGGRPWCSVALGWYKNMYTSQLRGISVLIPPGGCAAARSPSPPNTNASRAGKDITHSFGCIVASPTCCRR